MTVRWLRAQGGHKRGTLRHATLEPWRTFDVRTVCGRVLASAYLADRDRPTRRCKRCLARAPYHEVLDALAPKAFYDLPF